jgi:hypothetical protein
MLLPSSGLKSKPSSKCAEGDIKLNRVVTFLKNVVLSTNCSVSQPKRLLSVITVGMSDLMTSNIQGEAHL